MSRITKTSKEKAPKNPGYDPKTIEKKMAKSLGRKWDI
jgi:hypothetical protein